MEARYSWFTTARFLVAILAVSLLFKTTPKHSVEAVETVGKSAARSLAEKRAREKEKAMRKATPIVVLITGCSSGIGKSAALEFAADERFKVWATMRSFDKWDFTTLGGRRDGDTASKNEDAGDDTGAGDGDGGSRSKYKNNLVVAEMDVTSEESVQALVQKVIAEDGRIDIVINNAGYGLAGCLEVATVAEAQAEFDVNVWGAVRVLQAVLPYMRNPLVPLPPPPHGARPQQRQRGGGHIINISSTSGLRGVPCMEFYTGSKFALEGISDSLRYSLAPYNISVTNINAGPVKTDFTQRFGHASKGGRGSRQVERDPGNYLQTLTDRMIAGLNMRIHQSADGQTAEDLGKLVVNVASLRLKSKRLTDVPFNIGSNYDSSQLLQEVRKQPTGWGGLFNEILKSMPPLPAEFQQQQQQRSQQHEEL